MKKKVLFLYTSYSSFVKTDYEILSEKFHVKLFKFNQSKKLFTMIWQLIRQMIFLSINIFNSNLIYCWFADYHSFLPILFGKIFRKKTILVIGGYDVANVPEVKYGSFSHPLRAYSAKFSIKNATLNLAVSDNLQTEALERVPKANVEICYTGYSGIKFKGNQKKGNIVLTVGTGNTLQRILIKGIDFFLKVAEKIPDYTFIVVGISEKGIKYLEDIPENVQIHDMMKQEKLIELYQKAKVYAQFSMREGLPNAICEAMLCECIPVGFNNGGIPIVIGDAGFIIEKKDIELAAETIRKSLSKENELSKKARERIIDKFSLERRKKELINNITDLK